MDTSLGLPLGLDEAKASLHVALEELRRVFEEGLEVCVRILLLIFVQLGQTLREEMGRRKDSTFSRISAGEFKSKILRDAHLLGVLLGADFLEDFREDVANLGL